MFRQQDCAFKVCDTKKNKKQKRSIVGIKDLKICTRVTYYYNCQCPCTTVIIGRIRIILVKSNPIDVIIILRTINEQKISVVIAYVLKLSPTHDSIEQCNK